MRKLALVIVLVTCVVPARATVITTGDVDPGGAATQPDPWAVGDDLKVGVFGSGTLNVEAGGVVSSVRGYMGYDSTSTGIATITGPGSQWNNSSYFHVGHSGYGALSVESGGVVSNKFGYLGNNSGSIGEALVIGSGSQWNNSHHLTVGLWGTGTLRIEDGGVVSNNDPGHIGSLSGSTGGVTVTNAGSQWNNSNTLLVGNYGTGTLNVEAGGVVSNTSGYIANDSGSTGVATVTGSDSQWNNSHSLYVGGGIAESGGTGALNLYDSGLVTVSNTTKLHSTGTIVLNGGSLTTGSFDNSEEGALNFHDGTLTVNGSGGVFNPGANNFTIDGNAADDAPELVIADTASATLSGVLKVGGSRRGALTVESGGVVSNTHDSFIGRNWGSTGIATVTGANSKWTNTENLFVGQSGNGTLNIAAGGVVSNTVGYIGDYSSSTGVATVTGSDSKWTNSDSLKVGYYGDGTLNVEAEGVVSNTFGVIGDDFGSTGAATVTGPGSKWTNSSYMYVGNYGNGTLNVEAEGVVSNTYGIIGAEEGSTGAVTVTGPGSKWTNSAFVVVGYEGNGTLSIEAGGVVSNTDSIVGSESGSTSTATVTGPGSKWTNSSYMSVGNYGNGTLSIEAGGVVSNTYGYIGDRSGSWGAVTVTGTGSTWLNSGDLHVGQSVGTPPPLASGTLTIVDSGVVQVAGMAQVHSNGEVRIDGGTMSVVETLQLDAGSTVSLNSGTLSLIGFSGDGNLAWNGGTLELTGPAGLTVGASGLLGSLLTIDAVQTLNVINTTTIQNGARIIALGGFASDLLKIESGGQFDAPSGFTNQDEIQLSGADARITGSVLTNDGFISGNGRINALLINTGQVNISGGTILFGSQVTNNAGGFIGGRDVFFRFDGGLTNNGEIGLSVGVHDILGSIDNTINGRIMVAGQSTATFYGDITNDGDIFTGLGSQSVLLGDVTGSGNFPGAGIVEFAGAISPGSSPDAVHFGGDVLLGSSAEVEIELLGTTAGSEHDQLDVAGTVNLEGTLDLLPLAPYIDPATRGTADDFVIITAGARNGTFNTIQYDGSPLTADSATDGNGSFRSHTGGGLFRSVTYTAASVQLQNLLALAGDTDGDRDIDLGDYTRLATNFAPGGSGLTWTDGDFDSDGDIDLGDYNSLASNFAPGGYGPTAVPEPAAALLALLGMLVTCLSGRLRV